MNRKKVNLSYSDNVKYIRIFSGFIKVSKIGFLIRATREGSSYFLIKTEYVIQLFIVFHLAEIIRYDG